MTQEEMHRRLEEAEAEMRAAERSLGAFQELQPQLAELVGRAEAADGNVRAAWSMEGLSELEIDPRAMRMPSSDLADAVKEVLRGAMGNLREQTMSLLTESGVLPPEQQDLATTQAELRDFREETMSSARRAAADLDRAAELRRQYDQRDR